MMKNHVPKSLFLCNYFKFVYFHVMHNLVQTYGVIMKIAFGGVRF